MITLNIFDFDNTLFRSPEPNPKLWGRKLLGKLKSTLEEHGGGWYQNTATLTEKYIDLNNFIEETVSEVEKSIADINAVTALLTGRNIAYNDIIKNIIARKGLVFDYFGLKFTGKTLDFKYGFIKNTIQDIESKGKKVKFINIWEDREDHVKKFKEFLNTLGIPNEVHEVTNGRYHMPEEYEKEIVKQLAEEYFKMHGKELNLERKPNYYAVVLDDSSRLALLNAVKVPENWIVKAHHMTIVPPKMVGRLLLWIKNNMGKEVSMTVEAIGLSDKALAVKVSSNDVKCLNSIPHITVAVSPEGKAKDSNSIQHWENVIKHLELHGIVEAIY